MDTNQMNGNELAELKTIHLPDSVSIFPLAPGWYIVALFVLIIIAALIWCGVRKRAKRLKANNIYSLLDQLQQEATLTNHGEMIAEISILLKRVAMERFKEQNPHLLFGAKWLNFLDQTGKTRQFSTGVGKCLGNTYQEQHLDDPHALFTLIREWLRRVL